MLSESINNLKSEIIEYASLVEKMIEKSIHGLIEKDSEILGVIIEEDEPVANEREIEIEEKCVSTIAQFEPKAKDLRIVLMILKMNNDLERMADHAVNIADSSMYIIERKDVNCVNEIKTLSEEAIGMLNDSINSFIDEDAGLAKSVCERDSVVDSWRDKIFDKVEEEMMRETGKIERLLQVQRITKNLERIADLSTNICEDIIYMVEGRVIKHHIQESGGTKI